MVARFFYSLLICIGISTQCIAQEESGPPPQAPEKESQNLREEKNYSLSAAVARNHELKVLFNSIISSLQNEDHAQVADLMTQALLNPKDGYFEYLGSLHRLTPMVRRLVYSLPKMTLAAYRRTFAQSARTALDSAISSGDIKMLMQVSNQYPNTEEGHHALILLVSYYRNRGESMKASLIVNRYVDELSQPPSSSLITRLQQELPELPSLRQHQSTLKADFRPSAIPVWESAHQVSDASQELILKGHRDLRENGLTPFSPWDAQAVGRKLITVTPTHLQAHVRATGELMWSRPLPHYGARILSQLKEARSPLRSWNISRAVLFRIFGESLYSNFSHDNDHIYLIEETETGSQFKSKSNQKRFAANQVVCLDASHGEVVWKNASIASSSAYLCSPPEVWNSELILLAEFRNNPQLQLVMLDKETGKLQRTLPIAEVARPVEAKDFQSRDGRRQKLACPIKIVGSKAYCPTGAGLFACVDLLAWSVDWVYRYPRHDVPRSGTGLLNPRIGLTGYQWWAGWDEIQNIILDDFIIFVSPESHLLTLLKRQSGEVLWKIAREDGLYIACAEADHGIIVIGSDFARSYSFESGELLWKTSLNFPAGKGVVAGNSYLFPDSEFGWSSLDVQSGDLTQSPLNLSSEFTSYHLPDVKSLRSFVAVDSELYELSFRGIKRLRTIHEAGDSSDSLTLREKFLSQTERNHSELPIEILTGFINKPQLDRSLRYLFHQMILHKVSDGSLLARDVIEQLPIDLNFILNWLCHRLKAAISERKIELIGELLNQHFSRPMMSQFKTSRSLRTRLDRWLLANLLKARKTYSPENQVLLDTAIQSAIRSRILDHPAEKEFFTDLFGATPWNLAKTHEHQSVDLQTRVRTQLKEIEEKARQFVFLPIESNDEVHWGNLTPTTNLSPRLSANVFFQSVPILNIDGTPHTDINLEIEFPGHRGIRFSGEHWERPWPAFLPSSDRSLRLEHELVHAWAIGRMILLQVGSEIYGLSPFSAEGHRGASLLWPKKNSEPIDTLGDRSNQMLSFQVQAIPRKIGLPEVPANRMNEFGYFATSVGPVRAGYFCIQQKGMLVAYETSTGKELWRRYDLPRQASCHGDEDSVVVINEINQRIQIISAMDGSEIEQKQFSLFGQSIIASSGVHCLLKSEIIPQNSAELLKQDQPTENLVLKWINLASGEILWEKNWTDKAIPFQMDGRWIGVCLIKGQIDIIDIETGNEVTSHQVELPDDISKIACHPSDSNFLLLISGKISDEKILNATQQNGGYRRVLIDGPILGLNRRDATLEWTSSLENAVFPLDQPVDLPVFVTAGNRFPEEIMDDQIAGSRIQLFDRRTGKILYKTESLSPTAKYSLSGHLDSGKVTLTTRETIVDVHFQRDDAD